MFSAILELVGPVDFQRKIKPICMPYWTSRDYENDEGIITGWGWDGQAWPVKLKKSQKLEIKSLKDCQESMNQKWGSSWHTVTK